MWRVGALAFLCQNLTEADSEPGHRFNYASYVTNLLPGVVEQAYGLPAIDVLEDRIYRRLGAEADGWFNTDPVGTLVAEGHISLTFRDFARWALLLLHGGRNLEGEQVLPGWWAAETVRPRQAPIDAFARGDYADAFPGAQYHNKAWVLEPGRTMAMLGIHGQFCLLDLQAQLLLVAYASYLAQVDEVMIASTLVFWEAVREAVSVSGGRT